MTKFKASDVFANSSVEKEEIKPFITYEEKDVSDFTYGTTYTKNQKVRYNNTVYIALKDNQTTPENKPKIWAPIDDYIIKPTAPKIQKTEENTVEVVEIQKQPEVIVVKEVVKEIVKVPARPPLDTFWS